MNDASIRLMPLYLVTCLFAGWSSSLLRRVLRIAGCGALFVALGVGARAGHPDPSDIIFTTTIINQSAATPGAVVTALATIDGHPPLVYSLISGAGSNNNGSFVIDGSNLKVGAAALTPGAYSIRLRVTDSDTPVATYDEAAIINVVDDVAPQVLGVNVPANGTYPAGANLNFTVFYNEPMVVTTTGGTPSLPITLNTGGTVQAAYVSGSGTTQLVFRYVVASGNLDNDGIAVGAALVLNGGTITDNAVTPNNAVLTLNGVGATTGVLVDAVPVTITAVSAPADATNVLGANLDFTVTLSKAATVTTTGGTPRMPVTLESATTAYAQYLSGSGTTSLVFRYTVGAGDFDTDGIALGAVALNGGNIADSAGNVLNGTLVNVASLTGVKVDGVVPAVASIVRASTNPTSAATVSYTVTFSEAVTGVDASDFVLTLTGATTASIGTVTATSTSVYTVTVTTIGGGDGTLRLDLKGTGTGIADLNANPIGGGYTGGEVYTVDRTAPTVVVGAPSATATDTGPVSFTVTYAGADTITLAPAQVTVNATGTAAATVQVSGAGATTRTVTLTGITGAGTLGITLQAGSASDIAGNLAPASAASALVNVNQAPVVAIPIPNQTAFYKTAFTYVIPAGTFSDPNAEQTLTYTTSTLPTGLTFTPATRTFSGSLPLGTSTITVTATDNGTPARSATSTFTLTVNKAVLTVTAEAKTRAYGAANPTLTVAYTGFASGETLATSGVTGAPEVTTTAAPTSVVGSYPITVAVGTLASDNYTFTPVNGTLTVSKAPLTLTADNKTRAYNSINPTLTYTITGLANGETAAVLTGAPVLSTEANAASNVGTYPITIGLGTLLANNYSFASLVNGTFTVTPASVQITIEGLSKVYNGQPQSVTAVTVPSGNRVRFSYNNTSTPPTAAGSYPVVATSDDLNFTGTATATLVIAKASQTITFNPSGGAVGAPIALSATSSSGLPVTFSIVSGNATLAGSTLTLSDANAVTVRATQAGNENYNSASLDRTVSATARLAQTIQVTQPSDKAADAAPFTLQAGATSGLPLTYLLVSGPATISGSTITLTGAPGVVTIRLIQQGDATYQPAPDVTVTFTVNAARNDRIINVSSRSQIKSANDRLIAGFVIGGPIAKDVVIRGIGPALTQFGVTGALQTTRIQLYREDRLIAENSGWSTSAGAAALPALFTQVGAFPLPANSGDSALAFSLAPGAYSVHLSGGAGAGLVEVYDASLNPNADQQRLINISVRTEAGEGADALIAGFVISGTTSKRVLIRGIGPSLAQFGVPGVLADPMLKVFSGSNQITENDDWSTLPAQATAVSEAGAQVGAFPLTGGTRDAALVLTLAPGGYTAQVLSKAAATKGAVLIEVYELP